MKQKMTEKAVEKKIENLTRALKKYKTLYQDYFEENISGKYISTPDWRLIACNKEYERIFGFNSTKEAFETNLRDISIHPEERDNIIDMLKNEKRIIHYRPKLKKLNGPPIHLIENASGVFDKKGNLDHVRGFFLDITEQIHLQSQLLQAQKMEAIGTLAGGIAHDFNNILSSIFGYVQLAKLQINEPDKAEECIDQIFCGAHRASTLVQQILSFSRQSEYARRSFKVSSLLKESLKLLRSSIPANIIIKENIVSNAMILADSTQVHQVIMNLCTNAYHAMSDTGGTLTVELYEVRFSEIENAANVDRPCEKYLKLKVSDTGHGIDEKTLLKIFDPYFTTKDIGKGTGLGLAVVDGIVKNHDGFIQPFSKVGSGTSFEIFWPVQEQTSANIIPYKKNGTDLFAGHEKIMLVDDETDILHTSKDLLRRLGYKIETFKDGSSALKAFIENPDRFDLIITDMAMPNMLGDTFSLEILKIRKDMPIILCTGYSENLSQEQASEMGISKYIQKPVTNHELSCSIREVMNRKPNHQYIKLRRPLS